MRTNIQTTILLFTVLAAGGIAAAQPAWNFDTVNSSVNLVGDALADNYDNGMRPGPFFTDTVTRTNFIPGFTGGVNTFDYGKSANPFGVDFVDPFSRTSSSAVGVCTINGATASTMDIAFRANGLMDTFGPDAYDAWSRASVAASLLMNITGASPGQTLTVMYEWTYFGYAVTDHEGLLEDPANARGTLQFTQPDGTFTTLFAEGFDGDDPTLPGTGSNNGSGSFSFVYAPGDSMSVDLTAFAESFMRSPGNVGQAVEDLGGSEFLGTLRLEIVPAPGAAALLVLAGALGLPRRRRG
jgi:hypothetical protein